MDMEAQRRYSRRLSALLDKALDITIDDCEFVGIIELCPHLCNKSDAASVLIYIGDILTTSGEKLPAMITGTSEEVQHLSSFKLNAIHQHIEESLLRDVGSRSGGPPFH
jgi:hypothetical protein